MTTPSRATMLGWDVYCRDPELPYTGDFGMPGQRFVRVGERFGN